MNPFALAAACLLLTAETALACPPPAPPEPLTEAQVLRLTEQAGLPDWFADVAWCESRWQPDAHRTSNPGQTRTGDFGLWQINWIWLDTLRQAGIAERMTDLFDPAVGAAAARLVYDVQGYSIAWKPYVGRCVSGRR